MCPCEQHPLQETGCFCCCGTREFDSMPRNDVELVLRGTIQSRVRLSQMSLVEQRTAHHAVTIVLLGGTARCSCSKGRPSTGALTGALRPAHVFFTSSTVAVLLLPSELPPDSNCWHTKKRRHAVAPCTPHARVNTLVNH
jgi:hypothetical protein